MSDTYMDLGESLEEAYADIENDIVIDLRKNNEECTVLFFIVLREKFHLFIKSRLKKLMVLLKTPLKKFVPSCMIEITTKQGGKNHAEKED